MSENENTPEETSEDNLLEGIVYKPVVQKYAFNQTGNIFISMSEDLTEEARDNFSKICAEVSVFFAAMTKALHQADKSLYNYQALKRLVAGTNMFVPLQTQDFIFSSELSGADLAEDLMQTILNVQLPQGNLSFATETFNSMANEEDDSDDPDDQTRAANIVFKCESLMGLPLVTVILANFRAFEPDEDEVDVTEVPPKSKKSRVRSIRPRRRIFKFLRKKKAKKVKQILKPPSKDESNDWHFQKETYLFIPPKYFKDFVVDMSHTDSPNYQQLVNTLVASLQEQKEIVEEVVEASKS